MKPKILVVENEHAIQLALSGLLGRAGYDVSVAGTGYSGADVDFFLLSKRSDQRGRFDTGASFELSLTFQE